VSRLMSICPPIPTQYPLERNEPLLERIGVGLAGSDITRRPLSFLNLYLGDVDVTTLCYNCSYFIIEVLLGDCGNS
jgi:hypothetical protein